MIKTQPPPHQSREKAVLLGCSAGSPVRKQFPRTGVGWARVRGRGKRGPKGSQRLLDKQKAGEEKPLTTQRAGNCGRWERKGRKSAGPLGRVASRSESRPLGPLKSGIWVVNLGAFSSEMLTQSSVRVGSQSPIQDSGPLPGTQANLFSI